MNHEIAYIRQVYKKHTLSNSIIALISEARQVRLTRLFAQHDTTDYW